MSQEESEGALVEYGAMKQRPRLEDVPGLTAREIVRALFLAVLKAPWNPWNAVPEAAAMAMGAGPYDPAQRLRHSQLEFIIDILEELQERFDRLEEELEEEEMPNAAEAAAIFEHAIGAARMNTSRDKRRLIQNALLNAFDPELYREGMAVRMFELLDALEYPELRLLQEVGSHGFTSRRYSSDASKRMELHRERAKDPLLEYHRKALARVDLVVGSHSELNITTLGRYFIRFISEPDTPTEQDAGSASNG